MCHVVLIVVINRYDKVCEWLVTLRKNAYSDQLQKHCPIYYTF